MHRITKEQIEEASEIDHRLMEVFKQLDAEGYQYDKMSAVGVMMGTCVRLLQANGWSPVDMHTLLDTTIHIIKTLPKGQQ